MTRTCTIWIILLAFNTVGYAKPSPSFQIQLGGVLYSPGIEFWKLHFGIIRGLGVLVDFDRNRSLGVNLTVHNYASWSGRRTSDYLHIIAMSAPTGSSHEVVLHSGDKVTINHPKLINGDVYFRYSARDVSWMEDTYFKIGLAVMSYRSGDEYWTENSYLPRPPEDLPKPLPVRRGTWFDPTIGIMLGLGGEKPIFNWLTYFSEGTAHFELYRPKNRAGIGDLLVTLGLRIGPRKA